MVPINITMFGMVISANLNSHNPQMPNFLVVSQQKSHHCYQYAF
jgi:hypothetical protein